MDSSKIQQLSKKTIELLEETKKRNYKICNGKKKLFEYFANKHDVEKWEEYIVEMEKLNIQEGDKLYIYRSGINIILEKSNFKIEKKIILKEKKIINNETEICIEISEIKNSILENEKGKLRAVDELRNCVIPIEIRNELGIVENDTFKPHIKGNKIILVKERKRR